MAQIVFHDSGNLKLLSLAMKYCGGWERELEDNEIHCMMKVSFGHSVCALAVSHNKYNLVSTAEIYQANYRGGKNLYSDLSIHMLSDALLRK